MSEMKKTPNYQFNLPSLDDVADIEKLNENFTKIDAVLKENQSDNTVAEKIGQIHTKIGEPTDDHNKPTVFGKIAGILKKVVGIDDKVGTATDSATQQTLFGKIKGIASDVSNGLESMDNKIGKPTDDHTKQTIFGKIADLKNMVSEKATQMINKITKVEEKIGTSADSSSTSTIFGRLKKVQETTDTIHTNMAGKSTVDTINNKIGTSADSSSSSTLFGKVAGVKSDTAKIGYSGQNAGTSSLFAWFQKIKEETADKTTVNNINNKIGTSSDSSGSTLFGKINIIHKILSKPKCRASNTVRATLCSEKFHQTDKSTAVIINRTSQYTGTVRIKIDDISSTRGKNLRIYLFNERQISFHGPALANQIQVLTRAIQSSEMIVISSAFKYEMPFARYSIDADSGVRDLILDLDVYENEKFYMLCVQELAYTYNGIQGVKICYDVT